MKLGTMLVAAAFFAAGCASGGSDTDEPTGWTNVEPRTPTVCDAQMDAAEPAPYAEAWDTPEGAVVTEFHYSGRIDTYVAMPSGVCVSYSVPMKGE